METITWISFGLALLGTTLAIAAIALQLLDRPRLRVVQIHPGVSGSRKPGAHQWTHNIISFEVVIENYGTRPAVDCEAVVLFPHLEALPLHPQTRDHTIDTSTRLFTVQPKSKVRLVGAWNILSGGTIDGTKDVMTPGDFIEKATPVTILMSYGAKRIRAQLTKEQTQRIIENQQAQQYLNEIR